MDTLTLVLAALSICLVGVTFHAWRLGNERRDVALLGVFSGLMGAGAGASAILQSAHPILDAWLRFLSATFRGKPAWARPSA